MATRSSSEDEELLDPGNGVVFAVACAAVGGHRLQRGAGDGFRCGVDSLWRRRHRRPGCRHRRGPCCRRTPRRGTGVGDVGEPGPRALDLRGLGTRGLRPWRVGGPRHRIRVGRVDPDRAHGRARRDGGGLARLFGASEDLHVEADEYRELDDERVLVLVHASGRGKSEWNRVGGDDGRRAPIPRPRRQGDRLVIYLDRDRALADLGLKE